MNILLIFILLLIIFFIVYYLNFISKKEKLDVAVIVEPRKNILLIKVLKNYLKLLPDYTQIHIFHGIDNEKYILHHFHNEIAKRKIILTNLNKKNLSIREYNLLLTSKNFYNKINGENILIFQMDTCLCSNPKYKIEDFLRYDYVGAPWINKKYVNQVGNGGLSLRKKSKILEHINIYKFDPDLKTDDSDLYPEDLYFSKSHILNFPSPELASYFSTEKVLNPYSIGTHKAYETLNHWQQKKLEMSCPEFKEIFKK